MRTITEPTNARSRRTRTALLASTRAILEEQGFEALTMTAVADRAGVTRRAVYMHFASRAELLGALFDYVAGRVPRAPHWIADNGFEWIFRLAVEPGRMWRRYLLGNPAFLYRVLHERRRDNQTRTR